MTIDLTAPTFDLSATAQAACWDGWNAKFNRRSHYETLREWASNRAGTPETEEGASDELKDLAKRARLGMCRLAVRTFVRGLKVVGFRSPTESDDDPAWDWWQAHDLDARHSEVHRHAVTYGEGYVSVLPDEPTGSLAYPAFWSPLTAHLTYDRPHDRFPTQALLTTPGPGKATTGLLVDAYTVTPVQLSRKGSGKLIDGATRSGIEATGEPWEHGATYNGKPVCPVVRFIDETDDQTRRGIGVVEPMIDLGQAINEVNYNRLIVARYGAHDQKLIIGWGDTKQRLLDLGAARVGSIDEHPNDVRIDRWQASPLAPYTETLNDLREQFALEASIPLWATGRVSNVSADTVALIDGAHQAELRLKRDGYGESWETVLRLAVNMTGGQQPDDAAETIWDDRSPQSFAGVVDGITKLASVDVPAEEMLDLIPSMTQQRAKAIRDAMTRQRGRALTMALIGDTDRDTVDDLLDGEE